MTATRKRSRGKPVSAFPAQEDPRAALVREWARLRQLRREIDDTVHNLIGLLDVIDPDPDREDGADDEPSLGAPEAVPIGASFLGWVSPTFTQVGSACGCNDDRELGDDNGIADAGGLADQHGRYVSACIEHGIPYDRPF